MGMEGMTSMIIARIQRDWARLKKDKPDADEYLLVKYIALKWAVSEKDVMTVVTEP